MPVSRPLAIALAAAVLALVGFYATQGARQSNGGEAAEVTPPPAPMAADSGSAWPATESKPNADAATAAKRDAGADAKADQASPQAAAKADQASKTDQGAKPEQGAKRDAAADRAAARRRDRAERRERAEQLGMPLAVARALDARRTVVLFLRGSDSADDRASARAVAALRGRRGVAVFSDRIGRLGRYRAVVGELGITQAPAVVIVDRSRRARVVQGYVDPATLAQDVADTR